MSARRGVGRYTNKSGYNLTSGQQERLRKAVYNYNKRLQRAVRKVEPELRAAFPEKISFAELRETIQSGRELTRQIKRLERYRGEGFDLMRVDNRLITQAQYQEYQQAARAETRRRRLLQRQVQEYEQEQGRFRVSPITELQPVTPEDIARMSPERRAEVVSQLYVDEYTDPRAIQWQQNYIKYMNESYRLASAMGRTTTASDAAFNELIEIIVNMSPQNFVRAQYENPAVEILSTYDPEEFVSLLEYYISIWRRYQ